jgi:hypothetical protein
MIVSENFYVIHVRLLILILRPSNVMCCDVTSGRDAATRRLTSVEEIWDLGVDLPLAG